MIDGIMGFRSSSAEQRAEWRQIFLDLNDITGYEFAEKYVQGGYNEWKRILKSKFQGRVKHPQEWYDTLEVKLRSNAFMNIVRNADNFNANKWIAEKGWLPKEDKRTKESRKKIEKIEEEVQKDFERMGLHVIDGRKSA